MMLQLDATGPREYIELHEVGAGDDVLFAGNTEWTRRGARRNHNVSRGKLAAAHRYTILRGEPRLAVKGFYPRLVESGFAARRQRIGKASLERHQRRPVN